MVGNPTALCSNHLRQAQQAVGSRAALRERYYWSISVVERRERLARRSSVGHQFLAEFVTGSSSGDLLDRGSGCRSVISTTTHA